MLNNLLTTPISKKRPCVGTDEAEQAGHGNLVATLDGKSAYTDADFVVIPAPTNYDPVKNYFDTTHVEEVIDLVLAVNQMCIRDRPTTTSPPSTASCASATSSTSPSTASTSPSSSPTRRGSSTEEIGRAHV